MNKSNKAHAGYYSHEGETAPRSIKSTEVVVGFFPTASIWNQAISSNQVLETFADIYGSAIAVQCDKILFGYCPSFSEAGLSHDSDSKSKQFVCRQCSFRSKALASSGRVRGVKLTDWIRHEDLETIKDLLSSTSGRNWFNLKVDGVPIGRYAAYEFYLKNKLAELEIPQRLLEEYKVQLRASLRVLFAWKRLLSDLKPSLVLVDNEFYSFNRVVAHLSREHNTRVLSLGHGTNFGRLGRTLNLNKHISSWVKSNRSPNWSTFKLENVPLRAVRQVNEHLTELRLGLSPWVYSSGSKRYRGSSVRDALGILPGKTVVVALTSSFDESLAAQISGISADDIFNNDDFRPRNSQYAWLGDLIQWAGTKEDIQLVIRIHPRMFPNKRDSVSSTFGQQLRSELRQELPNVLVNWPEANVPLGHLLLESTAVCNFSSTAGLEAMLLGLPVVVPSDSNLTAYPVELNYNHDLSDQSHLEKLEAALGAAISVDRAIEVYRWLAWRFDEFTIGWGNYSTNRWTVFRVLNGLLLRKRIAALEPLSRVIERFQVKRRVPEPYSRSIVRQFEEIDGEDFSDLNSRHRVVRERPEVVADILLFLERHLIATFGREIVETEIFKQIQVMRDTPK